MEAKEKKKIGLWAWFIWAFVIGALLGCGVAWMVDVNLEQSLGLSAAILVLLGSISGAVGASELTWKARKRSTASSAQREYVKDQFTLLGWSLVVVGAVAALVHQMLGA